MHDGRLDLGGDQAVLLVEFNCPRNRELLLHG
ncbi:MAG: hypothetical protein ACKOPS_00565 [Cyanobium sp.]